MTCNLLNSNHVVVVIYQGHLVLKITDIMLEALFGLHLDSEEVITVLFRLSRGSVLVVKRLASPLQSSGASASRESRTSRRRCL